MGGVSHPKLGVSHPRLVGFGPVRDIGRESNATILLNMVVHGAFTAANPKSGVFTH